MNICSTFLILSSVSALVSNNHGLYFSDNSGIDIDLFQYCDTTPNDRLDIWTKVQSILTETGEYAVGRSGLFGTARGSIPWSNPTTSFGVISFFEPFNDGPTGWSDYLERHNFTNVWLSSNGLMSNASFFLSRQDAMVWMGCTPPTVRYYHMRTFAAVHQWGDYEPHSPMAGLGDTVNQANINTTGGADGSDPWNKTTVIITTADAGTLQQITSAFEQAGIPKTAVNADVLPSSDWIKFLDDAPNSAKKNEFLGTARAEDLWQESQADGILMLGRVTGYQNKKDEDKYRGSVSRAMIFHRKTDKGHSAIAKRPDFVKRAKGTGKSEAFLAPQLVALRRSLIHMMNSKGFRLYGSALNQKDFRDDYRCINWPEYNVFYGQKGGFCDAQPQDVSFSISETISPWMIAVQDPKQFSNPSDKLRRTLKFLWNDTYSERVFVNIGVNHATVKNVGFNSIMMSSCGEGFETPTNSTYWYDNEMIGSSKNFGDGFENLFVLATARSATCGGLKDILTHCKGMEADVMAPNVPVISVERLYLELDTATGPLINELLQAELLVFDRPLKR